MGSSSPTPRQRIDRAVDRLRHYFGEEIWHSDARQATLLERVARRTSRYLYLVVRGFHDDSVLVRAPVLTLTTLLALVPLLALSLAIAQGFGLQRTAIVELRRILTDYVTVGQHEVVETVIGYVEGTNIGALGGVGLLFLLWASINLMSTIESAFNDIWGVATRRPFHRRLSDYLSVLIIFPVVLLASTGLTAGLSSAALLQRLQDVAWISGAKEFGLKALPFVVLAAGFTFLYKFMPYTNVATRPALIAGCFTGVAWHILQWAFIQFQIGVTHNNVIYGTLAALPIFLIWLNASWVLVLVGCEIAYAFQHESTYAPPTSDLTVSIAERERIALHVLGETWDRFVRGAKPMPAGDLAAELGLPRPITVEILRALLDCGLLARTSAPEEGLVPARDLRHTTVGELLLAYRHAHEGRAGSRAASTDTNVDAAHARLEQALRTEGSLPLDRLLDRPTGPG